MTLDKQRFSNSKLIYKVEKPVRKTGFKIYADKSIFIKTSSSSGEIRISNQVKDFILLPESKKNPKRVRTSYTIITKSEKIINFKHIISEIFFKKHGNYIRPIKGQNKTLMKLLKEDGVKTCKIIGRNNGKTQLRATKFLDKAISLRESIDFPNFDETELVVTGWTTKKRFTIFKDVNAELFINFDCRMSKTGGINIPKQINDHVCDFFNCNEPLVCSIDFDEPIVVRPSTRRIRNRPNRQLKEFYISYIGEPKTVNVRITRKGLKLTEKSNRDFELKKELVGHGFNILSLKSESRNEGLHKDPELESKLRNVVDEVFLKDKNAVVLSEAEIVTKQRENQSRESTKHSFDIMVIKFTEKVKLYNIELKTSMGKSSKTDLIDEEISSLLHYEKILGNENILSILIMNAELTSRKNVITRDFGDNTGVLILGISDLKKILRNPNELKNRITEFEKLKECSHKESKETNKVYSFSKISEEIDFIERKLPVEFRIVGFRKYNSEGFSFEKEIEKQLTSEGYKIKSNLRISYFDRIMEIDHLCIKNGDLTVISCKDKTSTSNVWSISDAISEAANLIEYKKVILKADNAVLFVKVNSKNYDYISKKYNGKLWAKNVGIRIRK